MQAPEGWDPIPAFHVTKSLEACMWAGLQMKYDRYESTWRDDVGRFIMTNLLMHDVDDV